ncbi:aryl-sulfate sulfotransferase [Aquimarina addita]|uniref:Aryl-sulfate sulfotransferase n=1 Tax=Aquimarina addita TaxID=870485 RepID=A0ABP7XBX5_9FLAO
MNVIYKFSLILISLFVLNACKNDDDEQNSEEQEVPIVSDIILSEEVILNPTGYAPLSALLKIQTSKEVRVDLIIQGKNGENSIISKSFTDLKNELNIPVHGLYGDFNNTVILTFFDESDEELETRTYEIQTEPLTTAMPQINIEKAERDQMQEGVTLVSYYGYSGNTTPQYPFMFDSYGDVRWYLEYKDHPELNELKYDNGPERLANGNLYFGASDTGFIYEVDLFGTVVNSWEMQGYTFHHEVHEKPNGNFLVCANRNNAITIEDYIVEIDRTSKQIINVWDLNQSLDNTRKTLTDNEEDWIHVNAVAYDDTDDTIIVSGRTQGLIKLTNDNEVVWIMGSHKDWDTSGNGTTLSPYLLQPLDASGSQIMDQGVMDGTINHSDFEWNWYQHAPLVLPSGNIMLFDNGFNRNFESLDVYSRAVEFEIDAISNTIQQKWEYGKERGQETYSRAVSDVDYLEGSDHILYSPGGVIYNGMVYGKSIEVDRSSKTVIFEATIIAPQALFNITFHRTERLSLYP